MNLAEMFQGKKTHLVVVLAIIAAANQFMTGAIDSGEFVLQILAALGVSTLRMGMAGNATISFLAGYKTHILVALGLATIVGQFAAGQIDAASAIQQALVALGYSTLRVGMNSK